MKQKLQQEKAKYQTVNKKKIRLSIPSFTLQTNKPAQYSLTFTPKAHCTHAMCWPTPFSHGHEYTFKNYVLNRAQLDNLSPKKKVAKFSSLPVQHFLSESQREAAEKTRHLPHSLNRRPAANEKDNLVLSTELIMQIGHRKEFLKLVFRALALCQSDWYLRQLLRWYHLHEMFLKVTKT